MKCSLHSLSSWEPARPQATLRVTIDGVIYPVCEVCGSLRYQQMDPVRLPKPRSPRRVEIAFNIWDDLPWDDLPPGVG